MIDGGKGDRTHPVLLSSDWACYHKQSIRKTRENSMKNEEKHGETQAIDQKNKRNIVKHKRSTMKNKSNTMKNKENHQDNIYSAKPRVMTSQSSVISPQNRPKNSPKQCKNTVKSSS